MNFVNADAFQNWESTTDAAVERQNKRDYWPAGVERKQTWWNLENVFTDCLKNMILLGKERY